MRLNIIASAAFALLLACLWPHASYTSESLDNIYFSLDLPEGWELVDPPTGQDKAFVLSMAKKSGDCLINFCIMPYSGIVASLIQEIKNTMAQSGVVMGELRQDGDIHYCKFKKKDSSGIIFVGVNDEDAGMTTIYGNAKMQREACRILSGLRVKKGIGLFPDFKNFI